MPVSRALIALLLCATAAGAEEIQPVIARPITLPRGAFEVTLHGTYTSWEGSILGSGTSSLTGETLAMGADFGATDQVQLGLATALPIHPGAGFGTILGSAAFAVDKSAALRIDAGFESIGFNGDNTGGLNHTNRFFGGVGAPIKVPITPTIAFVSGRTGAVHFGHFINVGDNGTGLYFGSTLFTEASTDLLVLSDGNNGSGTYIGVNLPAGLLLQLDPAIAFTLLAGYSAAISIPTSGSAVALHFIPIGLEAVVSPSAPLDFGVRFFLDGCVGHSGGNGGSPGYFDMRALMVWFRIHA